MIMGRTQSLSPVCLRRQDAAYALAQKALRLDIERARGVCIHVLRRDGRMIPLPNLTSQNGMRLYAEDAS